MIERSAVTPSPALSPSGGEEEEREEKKLRRPIIGSGGISV